MRTFLIILVGLSCVCMSLSSAQDRPKIAAGSERYTPTKIEWLELELNSRGRKDFVGNSGIFLIYDSSGDDTITVTVVHSHKTNKSMLAIALDGAKQLIAARAKRHGWESWVKVKEKVTQIDFDE